MKVVLYLRYSSDRQTEQSIEGQRRVCEAFCTSQGHEVVREYVDRATSASHDTDKRLAFQQMIRDASAEKWQGVVVYKLDRFARNRYDSATYKARLSRAGVKVISATEAITDSPEGIILESVLEGMAEFYSAELAQKVRRGMAETALKGNSCGGRIPYGYRVENKKLVSDPETAPVAAEIFRRYADGEALPSIAADLNARGYRTTTGAEWSKRSFHRLIQNRRYLGVYTYNGKETPNAMPALIDADTFRRAQDRAKAASKGVESCRAIVPYLLVGKAFCGDCGAPLIGDSGRGRGGRQYRYYTCTRRKKDNACSKRQTSADRLEDEIIADCLEVLTPDMIDRIADTSVKEAEAEARRDAAVPVIEAEIKEIDQNLDGLLLALARRPESEALLQRLDDLEAQKAAALARLADAKAFHNALPNRSQIVWFLSQFLDGDPTDPDFRRRLITVLLRKVTVYDDGPDGYRLDIEYNILPDPDPLDPLGRSPSGSDGCASGPPNGTFPNHIVWKRRKYYRR